MRVRQLLGLAWRESRFARRRLFLFLSAISLGVAALVAVQGFASGMSRGVREEARALLGADVELSSRQPFGPRTAALLDSLRGDGVPTARVTSFASMALAPASGASRLVQVRAAEPGFPFYGTIETAPAGRWDALQAGRNALVDPTLLDGLRARVGDSLSLGERRFRILGTLEKVPGDVEIASAFAPRVFIPARFLEETGLIGFGSRVEYEAYLRLPRPEMAERFVTSHRPVLRSERVRTETAQDEQQDLEEALGRLSDYLGLVGVFALLLGGIGVASAMGAYMAQKAETVAVLRCLGASARQVFAVYLTQAIAMGLAGALLGVALGAAVQWVLPRLVAGMIPVEVELGFEGMAALVGLVVGVAAAALFALLPLLQVRRISPLGALRRRVEPVRLRGRDYARWGAWAALALGTLLLLVLQVGELDVGAGMMAGIAATLLLLWLSAWGLMRLLRRMPRGGLAYPLRQGLANLYRPGNQTRTVVLGLGFGVFLLATLVLVQDNLLRPLRVDGAATRANLALWDVQDDQAEGVVGVISAQGVALLQRAPIVPMRIAMLRGEEVKPWTEADSLDLYPEEASRWAVRREYRSTFRDTVVASERVVSGEWWGAGAAAGGVEPVSLERDIAGELGVEIGDTIVWDVQGVRIPTMVGSIREVDWARFEPNFFAVFPTSALEAAPKTWVVLARAGEKADRAALQREVVERYPNVAVLDLTQILAALDDVLGRVSAVIRFLAAFSIATGFVVLLGAVSTSRLQRLREGVLLKTIGATRGQIGAILFSEYLLLGLLAALAGTLLAMGAGWALARWFFEMDFSVALLPLGGLAAGVALLSVAVGLWASREVFRRTPMEAIREE